MNKLYISALALVFASPSAFAQNGGLQRQLKQRTLAVPTHAAHPAPAISESREEIFSSDFSNAADWSIGNISDPNNDNWVIGTGVPSGSFAIPGIASTTAGNGFGLFDSDLLCGGSQNAWLAMANPVDLSAYTGVVFRFEQYYRAFQGTCYIDASVDGVNWTSHEINDVGVNNSTPNPQVLSVNLSADIGGAATAWVRFRYEGGCDYAWMVDDVSLITLPDHEMVMDYGYASVTGTGYEYGRVPVNQMPGTINVGAEVVNFGSQDQTNVSVEATLTDASSNVLGTVTSAIGTMVNEDTVVTDEDIALPTPMAAGLYSASFTLTSDDIASDDDPSNNSKVRNFAVTADNYGLDGIDVYPNDELVLGQIGTGSFADNEVNLQLLNYYEVNTTYNVLGAQILLGSLSGAGSLISIALFDTTDVFAANIGNPLTVSEDHVVTAAEIAAGEVNLDFLDPINLPPGGYYLAAKVSKQDDNELYILDDATVPQPSQAALIYTPVDDQNAFVYTNGNAYAIRMISEPVVSVEELPGLEGVSLYPNPTTGLVHIRTAKAEPTTVEVRNVLGELVKTATFNGMENSMDLRGNAAGLYSVRISNGSRFAVERITLK
jgi:hypothetical protein